MTASLFERLGGENAIVAAVELFYRKVADSELAGFFAHIDMDAQIQKQVAFMTMAFGGPHEYTGRDLREAHAGLQISEVHFRHICTMLTETLLELGVAEDLVSETIAVVETTKQDVLGESP